APGGDGVGDAVDQLPHRSLARGRPEGAAKILLHDDVGRRLAPADRDLDVPLLEDGLSAFAADVGGAQLPLDACVAIVASACEVPLHDPADRRAGVGLADPGA